MTPVEKLLRDDVKLPSPPAIAVRILEVVQEDRFSFVELAKVIQTDPALASRVLRVANSSLYSVSRNITNVEAAVPVMGVNAVKNIALSFILAQAFEGKRGERFDFDKFWRRSSTAAVAAQLIASAIKFHNDETFIAALLQDIGIAAMFVLRKDDYLAVLDEKAVSGAPVTVVEKHIFGFDHQEVGSELLKMWGLPESVYLPIRYHHDTESAPANARPFCNVLWAADRLSAIYHGTGIAKNFRVAKEGLTQRLGLSDHKAAVLIDKVAEQSTEVMSQFNTEQAKLVPLSEILQEANSELSRLNFSYDLLLIEYKEAMRRAERLASELKLANERLRHAAFHDDLTGIYNRRYFEEAIASEILRSRRYQHPLSLMMFDIDQFKMINDKYGHHSGDVVLKTVGQMIVSASRRSDIVVRYGGEEFAILLPETDLTYAAIKAEACRTLIGGTEIKVEEHLIKVTISVGVAGCIPPQRITPDALIRAADQALYLSKRQGRNRIAVWEWDAATASTHP
jgi:diguanylate cyclase (GGDEF)-like protein